MRVTLGVLGSLVLLVGLLLAQQPASQQSISIEEFDPKSTLVVPQHTVTRAKYPFIDVHIHQRPADQGKVEQLLSDMDVINMRYAVSSPVNGSWGEKTVGVIEAFRKYGKGRLYSMTNIDFKGIDEPGYSERIARQLEEDIKAGAVGLKVWRNFGMYEKDSKGQRIHIDDPRYDAAWD